MKIAICDDNPDYIDYNAQLEMLLMEYMSINLILDYEIKPYSSGIHSLKEYYLNRFDLIFLDIDMPEMDGFETAKLIREIDKYVDMVFVTNMEGQSTKGYQYKASGYLYKPVSQEDINELIDRIRAEMSKDTYEVKLLNGGVVSFRLTDILYFGIEDHDISIVTKSEKYDFVGTLKQVENDLKGKGFIRIHKSYLVNLQNTITENNGYIWMKTGDKLQIARGRKKAVCEILAKIRRGQR